MSAQDTTIRHVVLFSSKEPENIGPIIDGLKMLGTIPSVRHFEVKQNLYKDGISNEIDVVVYAEFASQEDLAAYRAHPTYEHCIKIVRPLRGLRFAADF